MREIAPEQVERVDLVRAELQKHVMWQDHELLLSVVVSLHYLE